MKLSTKIILPIILISALLILLAGCFGVPSDESPEYTSGTGTITGIIAAPCCYTLGEPVSGNSGSPEFWCYYCENDWYLQAGVKVILTSGQEVIATITTDEFGVYTFTDVPPGENYVITAYCPDDDDIPLVKDVALELIEGGSFDAKTTDLVSTSLGLVVDFVVYFAAWDPEDISLDKVIAAKPHFPGFPKFKKLIREVRRVLENCEDVDEDDDLLEALCLAAEEVSESDMGCAPGYTPEPEVEATGGTAPTPPPPPPPPPPPGPKVSISLTKEVNADCYNTTLPRTSSGETLVYTLTVTNTGEVVLTNVTLTDGLLGIDESRGTLAVGASWTEVYDYDVPADQTETLTNTAEVSGTGNGQTVSATASVSLEACTIPEPGIELNKTVDEECYTPEGTLVYTLTVTNTGNVDLTDVNLTDDLLNLNVDIGDLAVGASWTEDYDYSVLLEQTGTLTNNAGVTGMYNGDEVSDDVSVSLEACIIPEPGIELNKTVDEECYTPEGTLVYTLTVTNTGNVDLTDVNLTDDLLNLNVDIGDLAVGASWTEDYDYSVLLEQTGTLTNNAGVTGMYNGDEVSDDVSVSLEACIIPEPGIELNKTVDEECYTPEGTLVYTLTVTNTGNVDLTDVNLTDDLLNLNVDIGDLAVGASWTEDYDYSVLLEQTGTLTNNAGVTGMYNGDEVSDDVSVSLEACIIPEPGIELNKTVDEECYTPEGTLVYTLTVTNTGNVDLTDVNLTDDLLNLNVDIGDLAVGASWTEDYDYSVLLEQTGTLTNNAGVTGMYNGDEVSDDVSVSLEACIISSIMIHGFKGQSCEGAGGIVPVEPIPLPGITTLEWLTAGTPNCKSIHFTVDFYDVNNVITYRHTTNLDATGWWESDDITIIGDSFTSPCIEIPMEQPNTYATAFDLEIDVNGIHTYTIYLRTPTP